MMLKKKKIKERTSMSAEDIGVLLATLFRALEQGSVATLENEVLPQLRQTSANYARTHDASAVQMQLVLPALNAICETGSAAPFLVAAAHQTKHRPRRGVSAGEEEVNAKDAAMLLLCESLPSLKRQHIKKLIAPYVPDIARYVGNRFPRTKPLLAVARFFAPKDISFDGHLDWEAKTNQVLLRLKKMAMSHFSIAKEMKLATLAQDYSMLCNSLYSARPIIIIVGDRCVGKSEFISFLLHPYVKSSRSGGEAFSPSRFQREPSIASVSEVSCNSSHGFTIYLQNEAPCTWSAEALETLPDQPFRFLKGMPHGRFPRTQVKAVGLPHPLLQSVILIDTPSTRPSSRTTAQFTELLHSFVEMCDVVYAFFDESAWDMSAELHALISSHLDRLDKIRFVWNNHKGEGMRVDTIESLWGYARLNFYLASVLHTKQPPYFFLINSAEPMLGHKADSDTIMTDASHLIQEVTETLPRCHVDDRVAQMSRLSLRMLCAVASLRVLLEDYNCGLQVDDRAPSADIAQRWLNKMENRQKIANEIGISIGEMPANIASLVVEALPACSSQKISRCLELSRLLEAENLLIKARRSEIPDLFGALNRDISDVLSARFAATLRDLAGFMVTPEDKFVDQPDELDRKQQRELPHPRSASQNLKSSTQLAAVERRLSVDDVMGAEELHRAQIISGALTGITVLFDRFLDEKGNVGNRGQSNMVLYSSKKKKILTHGRTQTL